MANEVPNQVGLEFLARQAKQNMDEMRRVRKEMAEMLLLVTANYDLTRRMERRKAELRDDIEVMIKMELGGSLGNIQTSIESSLSRIEESIGDVVERVTHLESKL